MKFGKEFSSQMVPEWQQAYMDYNTLKTILKDIASLRKKNSSSSANSSASFSRKTTLYRAFSGLTSRHRGSPRKRDDETILVGASTQGGAEERYQTMFLKFSEEGGGSELMFFRRLDEEFNKVVDFYKEKVAEVVEEADKLTRQMDVLIALRIKVHKPTSLRSPRQQQPDGHNIDSPMNQEEKQMEVIQEVEMMSSEGVVGEGERRESGERSENIASLGILENVKIYVAPETPISTLRGVLARLSSDLSFSKKELRKSEELMTKAFVEFYQKLRILKSYCFMNQLAFSKIMKKYDKVTLRNASKSFLDMVDKSYLGNCDEVTKLMVRVEATFVKHFSNGNRGNGMNVLRPKRRRERHMITFFLGLFSGCAIALVVTIIVLIQSRNLLEREGQVGRTVYMENIFPLYALFGFIVLHMIMLSGNIYFWRRYRVNYPFIFGLKEGTELSYREMFLLSAALSVLSLAAVISNLRMSMAGKQTYDVLPELVPLILLGVLLIIMFCPFNIIYRSSRFFVLRCALHCILAPLYKVTLPDFFMADQLTSQVQAFRSLQFYVCYYIWGDFKKREHKCLESHVYQGFYIVVAIIPYWIRFIQCLRRLVEEKEKMHALNGGKYLSIIIAVSARTILEQRSNASYTIILRIIAAVTSGFAAICATYWDIILDWGLLQRNSTNPWLRDKLIIPNKSVYFVAIVLNCLLRLAWMQTVIGFTEASLLHKKALIALVACLEIIRRGVWNFFRIENEHLNNVGKYRAFKSVPLPFNYQNDE